MEVTPFNTEWYSALAERGPSVAQTLAEGLSAVSDGALHRNEPTANELDECAERVAMVPELRACTSFV